MSPTPRELAETIVDALVVAGADSIFGVPGGGANLELVGAGADAGMRFILTHGETAACIAASTYGLLRDQPGAVTVTRGPGASSAMNGVAQATLDRSPLLLVTDVVSADQADRVAHQRLDQRAMMRPATKWSGTIGTGQSGAVAAAAVELARTSPMGAVHLDFDPSAPSGRPPAVPQRSTAPDTTRLDEAARLLADVHRPVLLVGAEAWPWYEDVRSFVQATGCPTLTTYQARGLISDRSPHIAGIFTNATIERPIVEQADVILAAGVDPVEPIPGDWTYTAPLVSLMPWSPQDRYYEPTVEVIGPIGPALQELKGHADATGWDDRAASAQRDTTLGLLRQHSTSDLDPVDLVEALERTLPVDATVTVDAGAHMLVAVPMLTVTQPRGMLISNGLATMGFALPAAIGVSLARPDRPTVALTGDGGLSMTLSELETVVRLDLPLTVVVFNDAALSLIEIKQGDAHGGTAAVRYRDIDFAAVARATGMSATRVTNVNDLDEALSGKWDQPRLVDVRVNPASYRHVLQVTRG